MNNDELDKGTQFAADTYRELYVEKYLRPPLPEQIGHAVLRGLVRRMGLPQVVALLNEYFQTDGDKEWYRRHGHSAECFAKNIGALNASAGKKEKKVKSINSLLIRIDSVCPKCEKYFALVVKANPVEVEKKTHFTLCPSCAIANQQ